MFFLTVRLIDVSVYHSSHAHMITASASSLYSFLIRLRIEIKMCLYCIRDLWTEGDPLIFCLQVLIVIHIYGVTLPEKS